MANRFFNQFGGTLERKVIKLFAKIEYVAGAPVLVTSEVLNAGTSPITINPSQGIESVSSSGAGFLTLVLGNNNGGVPSYDTYVRLLSTCITPVFTPGPGMSIPFANAVAVDNVNGASGNPSLTLLLSDSSAAPANPSNGVTLLIEITLSNTTAY